MKVQRRPFHGRLGSCGRLMPPPRHTRLGCFVGLVVKFLPILLTKVQCKRVLFAVYNFMPFYSVRFFIIPYSRLVQFHSERIYDTKSKREIVNCVQSKHAACHFNAVLDRARQTMSFRWGCLVFLFFFGIIIPLREDRGEALIRAIESDVSESDELLKFAKSEKHEQERTGFFVKMNRAHNKVFYAA